MAHAAVSPLPRVAVEALAAFAARGGREGQESGDIRDQVWRARETAARMLGCGPNEIALLGPTSLGLNLVADGLPWQQGDEVVCYGDDYPANVYPWTKLRARGVRPVLLRPERPGMITWEVVEKALSGKTRLVALASCHYLSGWRVDVDGVGRRLRERGVLFCIDGIQTLGAFALPVTHVDFLSADSHKWLLGPLGAGILYVRESLQDTLAPSLLGAWNVRSPDFIAQERIEFYDGARRYEPGALNVPGILAMAASMEMLLEVGTARVSGRILELGGRIAEGVKARGFAPAPPWDASCAADAQGCRSGIVSFSGRRGEMEEKFRRLSAEGIDVSLRRNREGLDLMRVSPHFYNTAEEVDRFLSSLGKRG